MRTMKKIDKHIEIVVTGIDGLNLMSKRTCNMIYEVLIKNYEKVRITTIEKEIDLEKLVKRSPDLVFSSIKCIRFEDDDGNFTNMVWLSEYLDEVGIKYTGSKKEALELDFDKSKAKKKLQKANIDTSIFFIAVPNQFSKSEDLPIPFPLFIKPLCQGGGEGINFDSIVRDFESYRKKIKDIFRQTGTPALVEKYLSGREFTVGIIGNDYKNLIVMPIEIISVPNAAKEKVRGSRVKEEDTEKPLYIKNKVILKNVSMLAKNAYKALGANGYGRIDIRMDGKEVPYFLEANLVPGLDKNYGDLPRSCKINNVMTYEAMILEIVKLGFKRTCNE
ncbi:ATP-grasp domain-containing protein [Patescibacteria group bacterium]